MLYLSEAPEWCILSHCHSTARTPRTNYHVTNIPSSKLSNKGSSCTNTTTLHSRFVCECMSISMNVCAR